MTTLICQPAMNTLQLEIFNLMLPSSMTRDTRLLSILMKLGTKVALMMQLLLEIGIAGGIAIQIKRFTSLLAT